MHRNLSRPQAARRPALLNELGQKQTPPAGPETFRIIGRGPQILVLGLGPDPAVPLGLVGRLAKELPAPPTVAYVDCPDFARQTGRADPKQTQNLPGHWQELDLAAAKALIAGHTGPQDATFLLYLPGLRLFPSFFGPLFGAVWAAQAQGEATSFALPRARRENRPLRSVTLVGSEQDLLQRELRLAFTAAGFTVKTWDPALERPDENPGRLAAPVPPEQVLGDLFFSVNFKGLDPFGAVYHYLRARDISVAVWCVDNPWHLLSALRAPYWRELPLFVTDASFLPGLAAHGAQKASHLPLAACPELFAARPGSAKSPPNAHLRNLAPLVFIGRTAFPGRDKFFAAQHVPPELLEAALSGLTAGERPDFLTWTKTLGLSQLWPGQAARQAGLAAEECARRRRALCVRAAASDPANLKRPAITIFGDAAWTAELADLPPVSLDLRGPVDYYTELPALYHEAKLVLNVTSLLLPAGLNQRHFDAWAAGSAQICDANPGLDIFPPELVRPLLFKKPGDIPGLAARLLSDPTHNLQGLKHDWQALIAAKHTYTQRVQTILAALA